jgi:hypothetical protein
MDIVLAEEVAVAVVAVELAVAVAVGVAVAAVVSTAADAVFITGPEEAKYPVSDLKLTKLVTPHLNMITPDAPPLIADCESVLIAEEDNLAVFSSET